VHFLTNQVRTRTDRDMVSHVFSCLASVASFVFVVIGQGVISSSVPYLWQEFRDKGLTQTYVFLLK